MAATEYVTREYVDVQNERITNCLAEMRDEIAEIRVEMRNINMWIDSLNTRINDLKDAYTHY